MYTSVATSFTANARDVERLIDFDRDVIDILIMLIGRLITPWARAKVAA